MKILRVHKFHYLKGGAERYVLEANKLLEKHAHQVIDFSMQSPRNLPSPYSAYFVSELDLSQPALCQILQLPRILYSREAQEKLEKLILAEKPDLAHLHNLYRHITFSIVPILKKYQIPIVMTLHDYYLICPNYTLYTRGRICECCQNNRFYECLMSHCIDEGQGFWHSLALSAIGTLEGYVNCLLRLYEPIEVFISPSQFLIDKFVEYGWQRERFVFLPHFINFKLLGKPQFDFDRNKPYLVYFGRLSQEKGIEDLIETAVFFPSLKFKIIGEGPIKSKLIKLSQNKTLSNVEFLGFKTEYELWSLVKNAMAVVVPSHWYENHSWSQREAMALGKVVIGADIGGIPELIDDGRDGFLYRAGDTDSLRAVIDRLLSDQTSIAELGRSAYQKIIQQQNPEKHYQGLMKIYQQVLKT